METKKLALVGVMLVAAILGAMWLFAGDGGLGSAAPPTQQPTTKAPAPVASASTVTSAVPAAHDSTTAPPATAERSEVVVPDVKNATLCGRCVDADGAPLAACEVKLHGWGANQQRIDSWLVEHAEKPAWKDPPAVTTTSDGRFVFTFWPPPPWQFAIDVTRDGCGAMSGRWSELAEGSRTDVGDVVMTPGVRVAGRVVDTDGVPQAKVYVTLNQSRARTMPARSAAGIEPRWGDQCVTRDDGTFVTRGWLVPSSYDLRTQQTVLVSPKSVELVAERATEHLEIVVKKASDLPRITGRVLDETGAPAAGVEIEDRSAHGSASTRSRRDGTFELQPGEQASTTDAAILMLVSESYEVDAKAVREVAWGTRDVEFHVTRSGSLTVRITDASEAPVETYTLRLLPRNRGRWSSDDGKARNQGKHENGTTTIDGVPRGEYLVMIDFPTTSGLDSLFEPLQRASNAPQRIDLRATVASRRSVRVLTGDDKPIADTTVQLCELFGTPLDDGRLVMRRDHWLMNAGGRYALVLFEGKTDAEGRLELRGPANRELGICVFGPDHIPLRQGGVRLDVADELVLRVSRGAGLAGKIVPPEAMLELRRLADRAPGVPLAPDRRLRLQLQRDGGERFPKARANDDDLKQLFFDEHGNLDANGLPPGTWQVSVEGWIGNEHGASSHAFAAGTVTLVDGKPVHQDFDLQAILPGTVEGLVLLNGAPLANDNVTLQAPNVWANVKTDADGRFTHQCAAGDYQVLVQRNGRSDAWSTLRCPTPLRIVRGQTTRSTFAVSSGKLQVVVLDANGKPVPKVRVQAMGSDAGTPEPQPVHLPPTDEHGRAENELTADTVALRVLPKSFTDPAVQQKLWQEAQADGIKDPLATHWITLATVTIAAGQTQTIELRLPADSGY